MKALCIISLCISYTAAYLLCLGRSVCMYVCLWLSPWLWVILAYRVWLILANALALTLSRSRAHKLNQMDSTTQCACLYFTNGSFPFEHLEATPLSLNCSTMLNQWLEYTYCQQYTYAVSIMTFREGAERAMPCDDVCVSIVGASTYRQHVCIRYMRL